MFKALIGGGGRDRSHARRKSATEDDARSSSSSGRRRSHKSSSSSTASGSSSRKSAHRDDRDRSVVAESIASSYVTAEPEPEPLIVERKPKYVEDDERSRRSKRSASDAGSSRPSTGGQSSRPATGYAADYYNPPQGQSAATQSGQHSQVSNPEVPSSGQGAIKMTGAAAEYYSGADFSLPTSAPAASAETYGIGPQYLNQTTNHPPPAAGMPNVSTYPAASPTSGQHGLGMTLGAVAAGAAAGYMLNNHHEAPASAPPYGAGHHTGHGAGVPNNSGHSGSHLHSGQLAHQERPQGALSKFIEFWRDREGVAQFEDYTQAIGICKYCFEPGTTSRDAPRKHHYKPPSRSTVLSRQGNSGRVDKSSRYSSDDESRRKKSRSGSWLAGGIAGGLAAYLAKSIFDTDEFNDSYSVRSGTSSSRLSYDGASVASSKKSVSTHSRETEKRLSKGKDRDGSSKPHKSSRRRRSRSRSSSSSRSRRSRHSTLKEAAIGAAIGTAVTAAVAKSSRSRSSSSSSSDGRRRKSDASERLYLEGSRGRRRSSPKGFKAFFTAPSANRHKRSSKQRRSFFSFANSSSSSADLDLAYGMSDLSSASSRSTKSRKKRSSEASLDAELLGLTAAAQRLAKGPWNRRPLSPRELARPSKHRTRQVEEDDEWLDIETGESSSSESVVSASLAYGSSAFFGASSSSSSSVSSVESGFSFWPWGKKKSNKKKKGKKAKRSSDVSDHHVALTRDDSYDSRNVSGSQASLQQVYPVQTGDPTRFDAARASVSPSMEGPPPLVRPGAIPLQQPQPVTPVSQSVYHSTTAATSIIPDSTVSRGDERPARPRRRNSSPVPATEPIEITPSALKRRSTTKDTASVQFDLTKEQRDKQDRLDRYEKERRESRRQDPDFPLEALEEIVPRKEKKTKETDSKETSRRLHEEEHESKYVSAAAPVAAVAAVAGATTISEILAERESEDGRRSRHDELREKRRQERRGLADIDEYLMEIRPRDDSTKDVAHQKDRESEGRRSPKIPGSRIIGSGRSTPVHYDSYEEFFRPEGIEDHGIPSESERASPAMIEIVPASERSSAAEPSASTGGLPWPVPALRVIGPTPPASHEGSERDVHSPVPYSPVSSPEPEKTEVKREEKHNEPPTTTSVASADGERHDEGRAHEYKDATPASGMVEYIDPKEVELDEVVDKSAREESSKPAEHPHVPGTYIEDPEFAATLAAGAAMAGFDPSVVTDDAKYYRRDSPPGSEIPSRTIETVKEADAGVSEHTESGNMDKKTILPEEMEEIKPKRTPSREFIVESLDDDTKSVARSLPGADELAKIKSTRKSVADDLADAPEKESVASAPTETGRKKRKSKKSKSRSIDLDEPVAPEESEKRDFGLTREGDAKGDKRRDGSSVLDDVFDDTARSSKETSQISDDGGYENDDHRSRRRRREEERRRGYEDIVKSAQASKDRGVAETEASEDSRSQSFLVERPEIPSTGIKSSPQEESDDRTSGVSGLGIAAAALAAGAASVKGLETLTQEREEEKSRSSRPSSLDRGAKESSVVRSRRSSVLRGSATDSPTAIPIHFRKPPPSPNVSRRASIVSSSPAGGGAGGGGGGQSPVSPKPSHRRKGSVEFKNAREIRPLWLVERHSPGRHEIEPEGPLPPLPSSASTSRTSSVEDLRQIEGATAEHMPWEDSSAGPSWTTATSRPVGLSISTTERISADDDGDYLNSRQATPTAATFSTFFSRPPPSSRKEELKYEFHSPSELLQDPSLVHGVELPQPPESLEKLPSASESVVSDKAAETPTERVPPSVEVAGDDTPTVAEKPGLPAVEERITREVGGAVEDVAGAARVAEVDKMAAEVSAPAEETRETEIVGAPIVAVPSVEQDIATEKVAPVESSTPAGIATAEVEEMKIEESGQTTREPAVDKPVEASVRLGGFTDIVDAAVRASESKSDSPAEMAAGTVEEQKTDDVAPAIKEPAAEKPAESSMQLGGFIDVVDAAVRASESKSELPIEGRSGKVEEDQKADEAVSAEKEPAAEQPAEPSMRFGEFADVVGAAVLASEAKKETPAEEVAGKVEKQETEAAPVAEDRSAERLVESSVQCGGFADVVNAALHASESKNDTPAEAATEKVEEQKVEEISPVVKEPIAEKAVKSSVRFGGFADVVNAAVLASVSKDATSADVPAEKVEEQWEKRAGEEQATPWEAEVDSPAIALKAKPAPVVSEEQDRGEEDRALEEPATDKRSGSPRRLKDFGDVVDAAVIAAVSGSAVAKIPSDVKAAEPKEPKIEESVVEKPAETPAEEAPAETPAPGLSKKEKRKLAKKKKKKSRDLDAESAEEKVAAEEEKPVPEPSSTESVDTLHQDTEKRMEEGPAAPASGHADESKAETRQDDSAGETVSAERDIAAERPDATESATREPALAEEQVSQPSSVDPSEESKIEIESPRDFSFTSESTPEPAAPSQPSTEEHEASKPSLTETDSPATQAESDVRDAPEPSKETTEGVGSAPATPSSDKKGKKKKKKSKRVSFSEDLAQETIIPPVEEERTATEDEAKKTAESELPVPSGHSMEEDKTTPLPSQSDENAKQDDVADQTELEHAVVEKVATAVQMQEHAGVPSDVQSESQEAELNLSQDKQPEEQWSSQPDVFQEQQSEHETSQTSTEQVTEIAEPSPEVEPISEEQQIAEQGTEQSQEEISTVPPKQGAEPAAKEKGPLEDAEQPSAAEPTSEAQPKSDAAVVETAAAKDSRQAQEATSREVSTAQKPDDTTEKVIEEAPQHLWTEDVSPAPQSDQEIEPAAKEDLSEANKEQQVESPAEVPPVEQSKTATKDDVAGIEQQPPSVDNAQAEPTVMEADNAAGKREPPESEAPISVLEAAKERERGVEASEVEQKEVEKVAKQDLTEGQEQPPTEDVHAGTPAVGIDDALSTQELPPEAPPVVPESAKEPEQEELSREATPGQDMDTAAKQDVADTEQPTSTEDVHAGPSTVTTDDAQAIQEPPVSEATPLVSEPPKEPERGSKSKKKRKKDKKRKSSDASLPEPADQSAQQEPKDAAGHEAAPPEVSSVAVADDSKAAADALPAADQVETVAAQPADEDEVKKEAGDQLTTEPGPSDAPSQRSVQEEVKEEASVAPKESEINASAEQQEVREAFQDTPDAKDSQGDAVMTDVGEASQEVMGVREAPLETNLPETAESQVAEPAQIEGDKVQVEEPSITEEWKQEGEASVSKPQPMEKISQGPPQSGEQTDDVTAPAEQTAVPSAVEDTSKEIGPDKPSREDVPRAETEDKEPVTESIAEQPVTSEEQTPEKVDSSNIDTTVSGDSKPESDAQPLATAIDKQEESQAPQTVESVSSVPEPPAETAEGAANEFEPVSSKAKKKKDKKKKRKASESLPKVEEAQPAKEVAEVPPESSEPPQAPVPSEGEQIASNEPPAGTQSGEPAADPVPVEGAQIESAEPPASQQVETSEQQPVDIPGDNEQQKTAETGDEFTTVKKSKKERRKEKKKRKSLSEGSQSSPTVPDVGESEQSVVPASAEPTLGATQSGSEPVADEAKEAPEEEMAVKPAEDAGGPSSVDHDAWGPAERAEEAKEVTAPVSTEELETEQARETHAEEETHVRGPPALSEQEMPAEGPVDKDESLRSADDAGVTPMEIDKPTDESTAAPVAGDSHQPTVSVDVESSVPQETEESHPVETAAEHSTAAPSTEAPAYEAEVKPSEPTELEEKPLSGKARKKLEKKKKKQQRRQTLDLTEQDNESPTASKDEESSKQDVVGPAKQEDMPEPTADQTTPQDLEQPTAASEPGSPPPPEKERESASQETPVQDEGKETTQSSDTVETDTKGKDFDLTDALVSTQVQRQKEDSRYPAPSLTSPEPESVPEPGHVGDEQKKRESTEMAITSDKPSVLAVENKKEEVEHIGDKGGQDDETTGKGDVKENKEEDSQPPESSQSASLATKQQSITQETTGEQQEMEASRGLGITLGSTTAAGQDEQSKKQAVKSDVGESAKDPLSDQGHPAELGLEAPKEETPAPAPSGKKKKEKKKKKKKRDSLASVAETMQEESAPAGDDAEGNVPAAKDEVTTTASIVVESQSTPAIAEPSVECVDTAASETQPVNPSADLEDKSQNLQEETGEDTVGDKKRKKKEKKEARKRRKSFSLTTLDLPETAAADVPAERELPQTPADAEKPSEGLKEEHTQIDAMELGEPKKSDENVKRSEPINVPAPTTESEMKASGLESQMETALEPATSFADPESLEVPKEAVSEKHISAPSPTEDETRKAADPRNETEQRQERLEVAPSPATVDSWSSIDIDKGRMLMEMRQDSSSDHAALSDVGTLADHGHGSIVGAYEEGASGDVSMQPEIITGGDRQKEQVAAATRSSVEAITQEEDTDDAVRIALAAAGFVGSQALIESAKKQAGSDIAAAVGTAKDVDIDPLLRSKKSEQIGHSTQDTEAASQSMPSEQPSKVTSRRQSSEAIELERRQEQAEHSTDEKGDAQAGESRGLQTEDGHEDYKKTTSAEPDTTRTPKKEQSSAQIPSSSSPVDISMKDRSTFRFSPSPSPRSPAGSQRGSPVYGYASAPLIEEHMSLRRSSSPRVSLGSSPSPQRMLDPIRESDEHDGRTEVRRLSLDNEAYKLPRPDSRRSSSAGSVRSLRRASRNISGDLRAVAAAEARRSSSPAESGKSDTRDDDWSRTSARDPTQPPKQTNQTEPTKQTPRLKQAVAVAHDPIELHDIPSSSDYDPVTDKGKRPLRGMTDVYEGWGETPSSPRSPTRPPSVRRRRSMQYIQDLEARLEQLISENRSLAAAKDEAEEKLTRVGVARRKSDQALNKTDAELRDKEAELTRLRSSLEWMESEVQRLTRENEELHAKQAELTASHAREVETLKSRQVELATGMEKIVREQIANAIAQKDAELRQLRDELAAARQTVQELQAQIVAATADDVLDVRDEDYFDDACQRLCQHVQQWVLRFSKHSDLRRCRSLAELRDPNVADRFENAILDGTDADSILADRVRRRDVFVSVVMAMIWEYIFTRYLFGMDREQRQKLKALEKQLLEIGPRRAVAHWRALTLTLLTKRPSFQEQKARDTEAVALEIMGTLSQVLPPPQAVEQQLLDSLCNVLRRAADLSIAMRTQRAEYVMLAPLQPEYNTQGDLARHVIFNASLMNERSGATTSNEELEAQGAVVRLVLFPLVVKRGDDFGDGDDEIVVCPAQVLVARSDRDRVPPGNRSVSSVVPSVEMS